MMKWRWPVLIFSLFPLLYSCGISSILNSGTVHIKYTEADAEFHGIEYQNEDKLGDVSVSIRNVQHPETWGNWALNFKISPSLHLDRTHYTTSQTLFSPIAGLTQNYPDIDIHRFIGFLNAKIITHTPIGQFVLTGGFGGTAYRMTDTSGLDTIKTSEIKKLDFVWIGFLSKRIFMLIGPRYYHQSDQNKQYVFALRLGYYWN